MKHLEKDVHVFGKRRTRISKRTYVFFRKHDRVKRRAGKTYNKPPIIQGLGLCLKVSSYYTNLG